MFPCYHIIVIISIYIHCFSIQREPKKYQNIPHMSIQLTRAPRSRLETSQPPTRRKWKLETKTKQLRGLIEPFGSNLVDATKTVVRHSRSGRSKDRRHSSIENESTEAWISAAFICWTSEGGRCWRRLGDYINKKLPSSIQLMIALRDWLPRKKKKTTRWCDTRSDGGQASAASHVSLFIIIPWHLWDAIHRPSILFRPPSTEYLFISPETIEIHLRQRQTIN